MITANRVHADPVTEEMVTIHQKVEARIFHICSLLTNFSRAHRPEFSSQPYYTCIDYGLIYCYFLTYNEREECADIPTQYLFMPDDEIIEAEEMLKLEYTAQQDRIAENKRLVVLEEKRRRINDLQREIDALHKDLPLDK